MILLDGWIQQQQQQKSKKINQRRKLIEGDGDEEKKQCLLCIDIDDNLIGIRVFIHVASKNLMLC